MEKKEHKESLGARFYRDAQEGVRLSTIVRALPIAMLGTCIALSTYPIADPLVDYVTDKVEYVCSAINFPNRG